VTTIIIPAHNESQVIGRLLARLVPAARSGELDVIVVANGCTDDTAAVAASFGPEMRVISIPVASKHAALVAGNEAARDFPRVYVDADVELGFDDVRALAASLGQPGVLAAGPRRVMDVSQSPWPVRWYYDVWGRLPQVRGGLFGRGAIAVSKTGHDRLTSLPRLLADDLAASLCFAPHERQIAPGATVRVYPPRSVRALLRCRVRAAEGVAQLERAPGAPPSSARTQVSDLAAIVKSKPTLAPRVALFVAIGALSRLRARPTVARGEYSAWRRDESSRRPEAMSGTRSR
jgi:hypothetical protein